MGNDGVHEVIGGIGHWITRRTFYSGEHIAIVDGERRISYADFDRRTDQLASALRDERHREPALITFLVTLSGITLMDIGSAFWGVVAGSLALFVQQYKQSRSALPR